MSSTTDWHTKYRPTGFEDVLGQRGVVRAVEESLNSESTHAFLFSGPSGVGKTTLARIIAAEVGCDSRNLIEIDAATHTGIDAMRDVASTLQYSALGGGGVRVLVVDECHALSKPAWQSLLKVLEEPPDDVYWVLCTTEVSKVIPTIRNRCQCYELAEVGFDDLLELLTHVADEEKLDVGTKVLQYLSRSADGSPRKAISNLGMCSTCKNVVEAKELVQKVVEGSDVAALCRAMLKPGFTWQKAMKLVKPLKDMNPESTRLAVAGYMTVVVMSAKTDKSVAAALNILEAFADPYPYGGVYPLLLSIGEVVY